MELIEEAKRSERIEEENVEHCSKDGTKKGIF